MWLFLLRRVFWGVVILIAASAVVFLIFYALPSGDPATLQAGPGASGEQIAAVRHGLGLDRPLYAQYGQFLWNLFAHFDLGYSYQYLLPVKEVIWQRLPVTLALIAGAAVIAIGVGVGAGVASAARPGSVMDQTAGVGSVLLISAPIFWLGYMALILFSVGGSKILPVLPGVGAWIGADTFFDRFGALVLPWLVLGFSSAAVYFLFTRMVVAEELEKSYLTAARARGIPESRIRWRYALRAGMAPLLAMAGLDLGLILAGNVVLIETVFNLPGVGRLLTESIEHSDLPLTQGIVLAGVVIVVVATVVIELVHAAVDPRVRR